ncbi:MAG: hypothetical protein P1P64_07010 [Treponemataceae bacterium]
MANEVLLTVTEEERRIAREISENNYQRMLKFESEIAREKGYAEGLAQGHTAGLAEGISEGYEKGEASGIQKGLLEGLNKGKLEKARETTKNLLQIGLSVEQISKVTGLSESEIEEL